jgi:hypothetical protein
MPWGGRAVGKELGPQNCAPLPCLPTCWALSRAATVRKATSAKEEPISNMQMPLTRTFIVAAALIAAINCSRSQERESASASATPLVTTDPGWPNYPAFEYAKPGHPNLASSQAALIRKTLALLKPCQAAQLRYAFPSNGYPSGEMVLFFETFKSVPHVLWTTNVFYKPEEGEESPVPYGDMEPPNGQGTAYEVRHQPCTPP